MRQRLLIVSFLLVTPENAGVTSQICPFLGPQDGVRQPIPNLSLLLETPEKAGVT